MATYQFQAEDGEIVEREIPMKDAPDFGTIVTVDGKDYARIISERICVADAMIKMDNIGFPRPSRSMGKWTPGCDHDKDGRPIIESKRHEKGLCERHGYVAERDL